MLKYYNSSRRFVTGNTGNGHTANSHFIQRLERTMVVPVLPTERPSSYPSCLSHFGLSEVKHHFSKSKSEAAAVQPEKSITMNQV